MSSKPPPKAAIPGRFKIPASGNIAPVGAAVALAVAVAVTAACPDEDELLLDELLEPPELPLLELLLDELDDELDDELELELDELLELLDELEELELDEELELLELLDDEELDEDELELDEPPATVKATLQFSPPSHSSARGRLLGAVGT